MNLHSILHGRCAFCYFHLAFLERLCDSVRPYGDVNVRPRVDWLSTADSDVWLTVRCASVDRASP